jgi:hypothetical protein
LKRLAHSRAVRLDRLRDPVVLGMREQTKHVHLDGCMNRKPWWYPYG